MQITRLGLRVTKQRKIQAIAQVLERAISQSVLYKEGKYYHREKTE